MVVARFSHVYYEYMSVFGSRTTLVAQMLLSIEGKKPLAT